MVEKKATTKTAAAKKTATATKKASVAKKTTATKKTTAEKKETIFLNAENAGFRAGDVYQRLWQQQIKLFLLQKLQRWLRFQQKMQFLELVGFSKRVRLKMRTTRLLSHK